MRMLIQPGIRIPSSTFAEITAGELHIGQSDELLAGKRITVIGVPAPFLSVCTQVHLSKFVEMAPKILAFGFDMTECISFNDSWSLTAWGKQIDPDDCLRLLSAGNLDFGRACCLIATHKKFFLGTCLEPLSMIAKDRVVERVAVERSILKVTCSSAEATLSVQFLELT